MKSLFIKSITYSMFILLFMSCKKDETKTVASAGTAPALTATKSTLVLTKADSASVATLFNWTPSSFGYNAGVSYTLQIDVAGNNFKSPTEIALESGLSRSFNVYELNSMVVLLGLKPAVAGQIEVRTKASISDTYAPAYSNVLPLIVTPFLVEIVYPSLWVPGSHESWVVPTSLKVSSVSNDGNYEGYVYFPDATTQFKFTSAPDFSKINYGSVAAGKLDPTVQDNIKVTGAGYYLLKANTKSLTYSATKTVWAVIGSATGSWDVETPMTYDAVNKVWTVTKVLSAGELKFRANGNYDINFGGNTPADGKLKYGGANIPVTSDGNYKITFNVSTPGNYIYTLTKL